MFTTGEVDRFFATRAALGLSALLSVCAGATVVDTGGTPCCSPPTFDLPPATTYGATLYRKGDVPGEFSFELPVSRDSQQSIEALEAEVEALEALGGPMAARLSRPVTELGYANLSQDRIPEAISYLQRAIHLTRVNGGLYTPAQEEMLEQLITAHLRQGDVAAADQQQAYLYRVRQYQKLPPAAPGMREATLRYADWMRGLYLADMDRLRYPRLVDLNDLYQRAIEEIEATEGEHSRALLPYLQGRAELSYLISVYPGEREAGVSLTAGQQMGVGTANQAQLRFWRMQDYNFRYGLRALERMEAVLRADANSTPAELAHARVALGDWYQWHRRYAPAIGHYEHAWAIMADQDDAEDWLSSEFATPLELPRGGVFKSGAVAIGTLSAADVQIDFRVTRHGEARDIEILTEVTDAQAQSTVTRAYRYLRNMRFRPSLKEGRVVDADNVQRTYQIRY